MLLHSTLCMNLQSRVQSRPQTNVTKLKEILAVCTSAHCTLAMQPLFCSSIQFASQSLGPIRKLRSAILSSSRTRVAVNPSLQCAFTIVRTRRNILAGIVCTSVKHIQIKSKISLVFSLFGNIKFALSSRFII